MMSPLDRRTFLSASGATAMAVTAAGSRSSTSAAAAVPVSPTLAITVVAEPTSDGGHGVVIKEKGSDRVLARQLAPMQILAKVGDIPVETAAGYSKINSLGDGLSGSGTVVTPAGSRYAFTDDWTVEDGAVLLEREVRVAKAVATLEMGFNSRLALGTGQRGGLGEFDVFLPGVRYGDTTGLPENAIGGSDSDDHAYVRAMRLTLPFACLRRREGGPTLTISHDDAKPSTERGGFVDEQSGSWWIHDAIQYASLGVHQVPRTELALVYPAMEGQRTYLGGEWARRSHPVREGMTHRYRVRITLADHHDFPTAATKVWRDHWARSGPEPGRSVGAAVHQAGIGLLGGLVEPYNGFAGLPFRCRLPSGDPDAVSYVMGFIGQQAPAGYQLLRAGLRKHDSELMRRGKSIIDFWVRESGLPNGLPKLWIDGDKPQWREWYPAYIRVAADGMDGVLDAARLMRRRKQPQEIWGAYVKKFGDFLVDHQNDDGSFYRAYNWDGTVNSDAKTNSSHPIRFLTNLSRLTGDPHYRAAAVRAGDYYRKSTRGQFAFVGGTADNPNVVDKEGGGMAMNAFIALYDATAESHWLDEARRAANYTATWLMSWSWEIDTPRAAYRELGGLGLSLIATGHSGLDNWLCYQSCNFYRLFLFTDDEHYRAVARTLMSLSLRTTQYKRNDMGYARSGLVEEAVGLSDLVVSGTGVWLPWCSVAQVEPLAQLEDIFGSPDLDRVERLPLAERKRRNRAFGEQL